MAEPDKRPAIGQEVLTFTRDIFSYLFWRIRQLAVLLWVGLDLAVKFGDGAKRVLMRYVFWGRGNWYRLGVLSAIGVAVLMLPFTLYREPITKEIHAEDEAVVLDVSENDLLVERGSSQTLIPKGRARMDVVTYTVKPGDTVSTIAEGFGLSSQTLLWVNDMSENDFIKPGQALKIPPGDGVVHEVEEGDTLAAVAEEYSAAAQAIVDQNWQLEPPDFVLTVGDTLFVPEGTMPPPPEPPAPVVATAPAPATPATPSYGGYTAAPAGGRFLGWPVAGGRGIVTQCPSGWHMAVDIADAGYPPLVAAAAGTVTFAGMNDPWGYAWSVQIDHGNGLSTFYAHMSNISVVSGQYVGKGQVIGTMGATGLATGVHVHFELRQGSGWGAQLNPSPYMEVHVCGY